LKGHTAAAIKFKKVKTESEVKRNGWQFIFDLRDFT
jgi:hypothetical protein